MLLDRDYRGPARLPTGFAASWLRLCRHAQARSVSKVLTALLLRVRWAKVLRGERKNTSWDSGGMGTLSPLSPDCPDRSLHRVARRPAQWTAESAGGGGPEASDHGRTRENRGRFR